MSYKPKFRLKPTAHTPCMPNKNVLADELFAEYSKDMMKYPNISKFLAMPKVGHSGDKLQEILETGFYVDRYHAKQMSRGDIFDDDSVFYNNEQEDYGLRVEVHNLAYNMKLCYIVEFKEYKEDVILIHCVVVTEDYSYDTSEAVLKNTL